MPQSALPLPANSRAFRVGDTVRCIDARFSFGRLTVGALYQVEKGFDGSLLVFVNQAPHGLERFTLE
jgi:hypothetical protein